MRFVQIKGYPDYLIYENGDVFSVRNSKLLKQCLNRGGYKILNLCKPGEKPKSHRVHRLVAEHFLPECIGLRDVNHIDGDKQNNHVSNLEWSNKSLNGLHAYRKGLNKPSPQLGEKHGMSKLKEEDILKIRSLHGKISNKKIAIKFDITTTQVWRIVTKKCWKHI
jgi:hypothetical protein